ncbi:MFS general substrate transporter [Amanita rubescens]|nr:MFS general substrate transporter [Amanita rubescens]
MSDVVEKEKGYNSDSDSQQPRYERPKGLKGLYMHPVTQVVMLAFICFMCPGLFNAVNGLGGGGQLDETTSANSNTALYATFSVCAFFAGSINNKLGSRVTLLLGSIGYCLYIGSYLALNIHPATAKGFAIASGAILGICAGLLWTAQGSLMMAYPTEAQKGRFISIFWSIFNLGAVVGAAVALGQNIHSKANQVGNSTYIAFIILTGIGVTIPLFMADPEKMIRTDGTKVVIRRHPSWKTEIYNLWVALRTDPMIILLFPMFLASNWFYTWQFNEYNGAIFSISARSLNNLVYWIAQIIGSVAIGFVLDQKGIRRRARAFIGIGILTALVFLVHIWAYFYQRQYTRQSAAANTTNRITIGDNGYVGRIMLYIFCGILDAVWQTTTYWLMGAMSNDPAKLAHFAGFYKSIQSAGAAGMWAADARGRPYINIFISTWVLLVAGIIFALPMVYFRVKDHTDEASTPDDHDHVLPTEGAVTKD